jgi:choline kinase
VATVETPRREILPVVLAAGMGSRLGGRPKALFRIDRRPLLDLTLQALADEGFCYALIITGHGAEEIRAHVHGRRCPLECVFVHNKRYAELNNFYSVSLATDAVVEHTLLIINCDVVFEQPVLDAALAIATAPLGLLVDQGPTDAEAMKVELENSAVTRLSKRVPARAAFGEFIGISTMDLTAQKVYAERAAEAIEAGELGLYYEDVYSRICRELNVRVATVPSGSWAEVDTPADVPRAAAVVAARVAASAPRATVKRAAAVGARSA